LNNSGNPSLQATGVTGHVGFRVLVYVLQSGYNVRAVVRREAQIDTIKSQKSIKPYLDHLSFTIVPDITVDHAFDDALKDITYVLHVASPLPSPVSPLDLISYSLGGIEFLTEYSRMRTRKMISFVLLFRAPLAYSSQPPMSPLCAV
jgi:nucleoside-diphosphate-sugar epimerase